MAIKKIAVRGGHCPKVVGTRALIDELTEDRKVKDSVIKYLKQLDYDVIDVTPPDSTSTSSEDLAYGVDKANKSKVDLFISIHFNNAYSSYNGAIGSEVCVYNKFDVAQRVVDGLETLGFKNRGQKLRTNLYELSNTTMKAMIIEVCFVEATEDVQLYEKLGADAIGKNIAESIANKKIPVEPTNPDGEEVYYRVVVGSFVNRENAEIKKKELEEKGFNGVFLDVLRK